MTRLAFTLLLLFPALSSAQTFNLFKPSTGILKGSTTTYVTTAAAASDVISLWSGSCSSTTFLRGDGSCQAPGGAGIGTVTSVAMTWASSGISIGGSPITSAGTLALTGTLNVATGGTGAVTLTGLLKGNGTSALSAAASADVISLWTGTCNSTTFLRGDGSCQSAAGTPANPTATVGPTATNGVATTFMRSDAAPAINLTSTYAWTGPHSYSMATTFGGRLVMGANSQVLADTTNGFRVRNAADSSTLFDVTNAGAVSVGGNSVLTTASSLPAANLTGSVADARLSTNVALKNVANQAFTVVGNNSLGVSNSSTGTAVINISTNGTARMALCSGTAAASCTNDASINDAVIVSPQTMRLSANGGTNSQLVISTSQIDLNATVVNANSSRINTVANSGRTASGLIDGSSGALLRSLNVTSGSRTAVGHYTVNLTAAGFTTTPQCVASVSVGSGFYVASATATTATNLQVELQIANGSPLTVQYTDGFPYFICNGP